MTFYYWCDCCAEGDLSLPEPRETIGYVTCPECGSLIRKVDVANWQPWIEAQVSKKRDMQLSGKLGTRKQSFRQSDTDIDRDGLAAELAACVVLCPAFFEKWKRTVEVGGNNRGRDFAREWLGLNKPIEIKHTRYKSSKCGYLLVRPPRYTPGAMLTDYIDDSIYILLYGEPYTFEVVGWTDRQRFIERGRLNPVPVAEGQRECWGILWSNLNSMETWTTNTDTLQLPETA